MTEWRLSAIVVTLAVVAGFSLALAACGSSASSEEVARPETGQDQTASASTSTSSSASGSSPVTPSSTASTTAASSTSSITVVMSDTASDLDHRPFPTTAEALADELSQVEQELGQTGLDAAAAKPWGRRQQLLYRVLSANPGWADTVVAQVDPAVHDVVALNWEARTNLSSLVNSEKLADELPAWRISSPRPADELIGYYHEAAERTGVPWEILAAINLVETRMGRITGLSSAGAVGPMQFLPSTWASCCTGDPTDDHDAIIGAAEYLVDRGALDNIDRAVFGYNNSNYYVRAVKAYAAVLTVDPQRYYGFHAWDVVFASSAGLLRIPEGYSQTEPLDAGRWLQDHPDALVLPASP